MDEYASSASPLKSRLPTLKPSRLPSLKPTIPAPSHAAAQDAKSSFLPSPIKPPPARASPVKPSLPKPTPLSKRSSVAGAPSGLPPPRTISHRATQSVHATDSRTPSHAQRPESRTASRLVRPTPRKTQVHSFAARTEDSNDQLGSLEGFRAASRQSSRAESPTPDDGPSYAVPEQTTPIGRKSSRLSLSDRTIESISRLPPTPVTERRRSSFFPSQSPMRPPSRPGSSLSMTMRPGSSDSSIARPASRAASRASSPTKQPPTSIRASNRVSIDYSQAKSTPSKRSISAAPPRSMPPPSRPFGQSTSSRPGSSKLPNGATASRLPGTPAAAIPKSSAALSNFGASTAAVPKPSASLSSFGASTAKRRPLSTVTTATRKAVDTTEALPQESAKAPTSSAGLREQIAKAKAAKRAAASTPDQSHVDGSDEYEFDLSADPFNAKPKQNNGLLLKRIDAARADGRLNIAALQLKSIPGEVLRMYDADEMAKSNISWNETVDLTRLGAADNEFEAIPDDIFPDISNDDASLDSEDATNSLIFRGIETLDLHGNLLTAVPVGLRRLERLSVVNLSHNKLNNASCEVLGEIEALRELRLAHNNLSGYLPQTLNRLRNLHTLDLQSNKLLSLPEGLRDLVHLQVLNVSHNQLTGLPMDALEALPLTDLSVANNAMVGALFSFSVSGLPRLQYLDVSNNSLASLAFSETVALPALRSLNIANNRIVALPDVSGWTELVTLTAGDNKIATLPSGFCTLKKIKQADFTGNDLARLQDEIGLMDCLKLLKVAANPLKERKFLNLNTDDLKLEFRRRLKSGDAQHSRDDDFEDEGIDVQSPGQVQSWQLSSGVLNLTSKDLVNEDADEIRSFLSANSDVRELVLAKNSLTVIPFEISLAQNLQVLDVSSCLLEGEYLSEMVSFQVLRELNISGNRLDSWDPLDMLHAPRLTTLDVSNNRLVGSLPVLRGNYPELKVLNARDNKLDAISADALEGLHSVDVCNNNIGYLPPEIGLNPLKGFNVSGNSFRVPNYRVLEKGTQATLAWLRDKIPEEDRVQDLE